MAQALPAPKGVKPMFIRGATLEKFGMKTGPGVNDVVDYKYIPKADIMKDIQTFGMMCDFEPAKKEIDSYGGDQILVVVDREQKYGETYLICYTDEAKEEIMRGIFEEQEALQEQLRAEMKLEEERKAAEQARLNVVYEDKPLTPRPWRTSTSGDTEVEVRALTHEPTRERVAIEISRPKKFQKQNYRFTDRNADIGGVAEFRAVKDPNFKLIREAERGIQVASTLTDATVQTTYFRSVNKAVQYESATTATSTSTSTSTQSTDNISDNLLFFLEKATVRIEQALQQNESVDIFHDTFRLHGDEDGDGHEGVQTDSDLRYLKNFADANYSKNRPLVAIDWMPKMQGLVAVSAVRNLTFDQRIPILGQTQTSYVLLWDFRLLVKPLLIMQSHHEIFTFRFNRTNPNIVIGGCITGQVVLWDITESMQHALGKSNNNNNNGNNSNANADNASSLGGGANSGIEEETLLASLALPQNPKYISTVDHSHKRPVADLFWLPPSTQINHRGQLVGEEHLDGQSYQFVTVAGDGMVMVWDIRYEKIFNDELRHIGRAKHVPTEKVSNANANANATAAAAGGNGGGSNANAGLKPLWAPIFKTHLKRMDGVGELSLCRVCETANAKYLTSSGHHFMIGKPASMTGDHRAQFMIATEEGDVIFADLAARKETSSNTANKEEDEDEDAELSCVKWITKDHSRPSVHMQESPFFPQIILSVSDWNFHIWKLGEDKPLFTSPLAHAYLTAGCWSNTRPAVILLACADGQILVWDFTDSSFHHSLQLKAAPYKITSMELLASGTTTAAPVAPVLAAGSTATAGAGGAAPAASTVAKFQLLAVGDEAGTLHIHEMPYTLTKKVNREEIIMQKFLERELQRIELEKAVAETEQHLIGAESAALDAAGNRAGMADNADFLPPAVSAMTGGAAGGNAAPPTVPAASRPGTSSLDPNSAVDLSNLSAAELQLRAELAALQKEEEEFLKMEAMYITEMGLGEPTEAK